MFSNKLQIVGFPVSGSKIRDDHQNLKLLSIDLNQMHLIGLVERIILGFKSSKLDVSLQSLWPLEYWIFT